MILLIGRLMIQQLSFPTLKIYSEIEDQILINAAKKLKMSQSLASDQIESWQMNKLGQLNNLTRENIKVLSDHSDIALKEVSQMLEKVGYQAVKGIESDLKKAAAKGILRRAGPIGDSEILWNILKVYEDQSKDWMNMVNSTMLRQSGQQYLDIINSVTGKVLTGVSTPHQALREIAREWANEGIPAMIDKLGREWSTEAYINMVTRSTSGNVANEMQFARMDEYGTDLIEVSSHSGARPGCEPYQGRIYSRSGKDKNYPDFGSTSYGEAAGLFGINCGHRPYPYIPGITEQTYHPYDKEENDKVYEESQKQRYLEREIRKAKKEYNVMEALEDKEGIEAARQRVLERQANMRNFIDESGRTRRRNREQLAVSNPHVR